MNTWKDSFLYTENEILPVWVAHGNIRWSEEENGEKKEEVYYNGIIGRVNAVTGEML
ncbi:hypothetical protein QJ036_11335 [Ruminococcus sp. YH-rum2234]|uniref:Uncharacterized protein n=1 Tax=Fusibacillus kribbianus TaxID=3044208 RepID=A0AAP4EYK8_9FIRM|nr:hypothetical protein [Ruminococcus sp. YH-rum2234]